MLRSNKILSLILTCGLSLSFAPIQSISETTATACAIGGGTFAGAAAGYGIYAATQAAESSSTSSLLWAGLGGAAIGFTTGGLIYSIMNSYTPTGRFAYAQGIIYTLLNDPVISKATSSNDLIIARITSTYGTSWPLICAREELMRQSVDLGSASAALNAAYQEATQSPGSYPNIMQEYQKWSASIPGIYGSIEQVLLAITTNKLYDQQVKLFEKHQTEIRRQQHERSLQLEKQAHESWENEKERMYKKEENKKDRTFIANKPNASLKFNMGGR